MKYYHSAANIESGIVGCGRAVRKCRICVGEFGSASPVHATGCVAGEIGETGFVVALAHDNGEMG